MSKVVRSTPRKPPINLRMIQALSVIINPARERVMVCQALEVAFLSAPAEM